MLGFSINTLKKKKILQNNIARKRLNKANFHYENIKLQNIDYICCLPINGYSSSLLQEIRTLLNAYDYNVAQFTTNSFKMLLEKNGIKIEKKDRSQFYIGQMLILLVDLKRANTNTLNIRERHTIEKNCLKFLNYSLQKIPFSTILYLTRVQSQLFVPFNNQKYMVAKSISNNFIESLPIYFNSNIGFKNFTNNITGLIQLLLMQIIFLLNILLHKDLKKHI